MKWAQSAVLGVALILAVRPRLANAQDYEWENSRLNTNIAFNLTAPTSPTSRFSDFGFGGVAGAGFNFDKHNAFVGEFMWNRLHIKDKVLAPIRLALQNPEVHGHSDLFAFTGNYKLEFRGRSLGTYFIAGAGFYYRSTQISKEVVTGSGIVCEPVWLWFGANCVSGVVTSGQTIANFASGVFGGNAGVGFTVRIGEEPRYRFYMEARYHYAPHERVKTEAIPIGIGIRF